MKPVKAPKPPQLNHLIKPGQPWRHALLLSKDSAHSNLIKLQKPHVAVRFIRGAKCPTVEDFFTEIAAALQFPHYFGENWDACADCLCDLAWLGAEALVIAVYDAPDFLKNASKEEIDTFNSLFDQVLEYWNAPASAGKPRLIRAVQLVFQSDGSSKSNGLKKWNIPNA